MTTARSESMDQYYSDLPGLKRAFETLIEDPNRTSCVFGGVYVLHLTDSGMSYTLTAMGRKLVTAGADGAYGQEGSSRTDTRMINGLLKLLGMDTDYKAVKGKVKRY